LKNQRGAYRLVFLLQAMTPKQRHHQLFFFLLFFISSLSAMSQVNRPVYWTKNYGGSSLDDAACIKSTADGGHIMCGSTISNDHDVGGLHGSAKDIWLVKLSKTGAIEWQKTYEGTYDEDANSLILTSDGGYAISGTANMFTGTANALILKISSTGVLQWQKQIGGSSADRGWQLAETTDGGFVITGETIGTPDGDFAGLTNHGDYDLFVAKLSSTGTFLWAKIYGGNQHERGFVIRQLSDGNLLVAGRAVSDNGDVTGNHNNYDAGDYWVLKLTPAGNVIWKKCYGGDGDETPYNAFEKNNRYYLIGTTMNLSHAASGDVNGVIDGYDMWFVVLDTDGNLIRQKCIGGTSSVDFGLDIAPTIDNKFIIAGYSQSDDVYVSGNHGLTDFALIKIDSLGTKQWGKLFGTSQYDRANSVSVNADSSFSLLGNVSVADGDVTAIYGNSDFWLVNYTDTSLYPDLHVKLTGNTQSFVGNKIKYKLIYGKNNNVVAGDTLLLQFIKDSRLQLLSSSRPVSYVSGNTLVWKIPANAVHSSDTTSLQFGMDPGLAFSPDSFRVKAIFGPYDTEFFQSNNVDSITTKMKYQNAAITNPVIDITSIPTVAAGQVVHYTIPYSFQSLLDVTNGTVRLVKDQKIDFVSASPPYSGIVGDTLIWDFSTTLASYSATITMTLHVKDTPVVQPGNIIKNITRLQFTTIDSVVLKRTDSLQQSVNLICTAINNVHTTLPPPQGIQWLRLFGGSASDFISGMAAVSDSSFVAAAIVSSHDEDVAGSPAGDNSYAIKYLTNGNMVWKKQIGGAKNDYLYSVVKAENGSVILAGETNSTDGAFSGNHGNTDVVLTKLDSAGNTVWQKLFGGSRDDGGQPLIRKIRDNKYMILASTSSNDGNVVNPYPDLQLIYQWLFIIDGDGTILSQKVLPDTLFTYFYDVQVTLDKGFILAGLRDNFDTTSLEYSEIGRIVKTDSLGTVLFAKQYTNLHHDQGIVSIAVGADSSFTFTGFIDPGSGADSTCTGLHGDMDVWVGRIDKNGNLLWQKFYGGSSWEAGLAIIKTLDGGYLITGESSSNNGNASGLHDTNGHSADAWIIKLDGNGELAWQKMIGGSENDEGLQAIEMPNSEIIVSGDASSYNNGDIFGSRGDFDGLIFKIGAANNIRGMVYADDNGNHMKDGGESYFTQGIVKSTKGSLVSSSDIVNGFYAISVDTGTYVTQPVINFPYYTSYPVTDTSVFTNYLQADTIDFAMSPLPGINDLKVTVLPLTAARPGFGTQYKIKYENAGTTTFASGNVTLVKDHRAVFDSASLAYTSIAADTIKWNFSNFQPMQTKEFTVYLKLGIPPVLNNGDTLHSYVTVNPIAADSTPLNNSAEINQLVTSSFDPNDKTETHGPGFPAQLLANGEYLNYIIRFQNTGSDTAFRVLVRDTLDAKLDWNSLEMISVSHSYRLTIADQNKLEWKFDPIILPDSTHNMTASQGFIAYRIKPKPNLSEGDTIANRAGIYFDFNLPVITNTQQTVIDHGVSVCPGQNTVYSSGIPGAQAFQWQVNSGNGYINLANGGIYSGVTTDSLRLTAPSSSYSGNKYRCMVTTASGTVPGATYLLQLGATWTGAVSTAWENPGNWNCGVVPDAQTDVIISKAGTITVNSTTAIRSLNVKPGVQFMVGAGVEFKILH
jgi:uncharacterized repeat protein (TIGR01451 family)